MWARLLHGHMHSCKPVKLQANLHVAWSHALPSVFFACFVRNQKKKSEIRRRSQKSEEVLVTDKMALLQPVLNAWPALHMWPHGEDVVVCLSSNGNRVLHDYDFACASAQRKAMLASSLVGGLYGMHGCYH